MQNKKPYAKAKSVCAIAAVVSLVLAIILRETDAAWVFFGLALIALMVNFVLELLQQRYRKRMSKETDSAPVEPAKTKEEQQEANRVRVTSRLLQKPEKADCAGSEPAPAPKQKGSEKGQPLTGKPAKTTAAQYRMEKMSEKQRQMQEVLGRMAVMLMLESKYNAFSHYLAVDKESGQPYEVKTKVVGMMGPSYASTTVEEFAYPPRKLTYEQFIAIADKKYPSISVLLEGINESNWQEYGAVSENWRGIPEEKKPITKDLLDKTHVCYKLEQKWDVYQRKMDRMRKAGTPRDHTYLVMDAAKFLTDKGMAFCRMKTSGGIDEAGHLGSCAYCAEYTNLAAFRDNFKADLIAAEKEEHLSMDYRYVDLYMRKGNLRFLMAVGASEVLINWYDVVPEDMELIRSTNEVIAALMGEGVWCCRKVVLKHEYSLPQWYIAQWDIPTEG